MRLMSRGNNVKHCDTSCKITIKMPSLLLSMDAFTDILPLEYNSFKSYCAQQKK